MLIKPTREEGEAFIGFAYELALDPARSGYPTYTDGIKTKEDFIDLCRRGLTRDDRQVLLYLEEGVVSGWIQFTHLKEDAYLQTDIFNIAGDIRQALTEFASYCQEHYHGYTLYFGFPADNKEAVSYLAECGWTCVEQSFNDVLFFDRYQTQPVDSGILKVDRKNFADFRKLHEPIEEDMYWNSDRLWEDLEHWEIFLYYRDQRPAGAIYYTDEDVLVEIFGVDFADNRFDEDVFRRLLTKALNDCKESGKKYMVFFNDKESQSITLDMGFHCVGEYVLFVKKTEKGARLCE